VNFRVVVRELVLDEVHGLALREEGRRVGVPQRVRRTWPSATLVEPHRSRRRKRVLSKLVAPTQLSR